MHLLNPAFDSPEMNPAIHSKTLVRLLLISLIAPVALAQNQPTSATTPPTQSENGAILVYGDSGWSFGLPGVRASVGSLVSPERKNLIAPSVGVGITAWKFIVPFVDLTAYDTGKASATVGSLSSQVTSDTFGVTGGVRLVVGKSRVRGYAEFGGGIIHQSLKGNFYVGTQVTPVNANSSVGTTMYGAGMQVFGGRRWGSDIGFDGFHVAQALNGAGQNFSRIRIGVFFQTKSTIP